MRVILATCSPSEADALLDALLRERLVACGNLIPGVQSRYFWEGEIQSDEEILMLMETTDENAPAAVARLRELHSYDVPKILHPHAGARRGELPDLAVRRHALTAGSVRNRTASRA
jgi:periplasmic divalent cation tolerance protein